MRALALLALVACKGTDSPATDSDPGTPVDTDLPTDTGTDTDAPVDTDEVPDTDSPVDTGDTAPVTGCVSTVDRDVDGDGTTDIRQITTEDGSFTTHETDQDGDGQIDERAEITWNATRTVVLLREHFLPPSPAVTYRLTTVVDAQDRPVQQDVDADADGLVGETTTWAYHPSGVLQTSTYAADPDEDGAPNAISISTYDTSGRIVTATSDTDGDGTPELTDTWTYEPQVTTHDVYSGVTLLRRDVRTTDASGRLVLDQRDNDGDGTFTSAGDRVSTYSYTPTGRADVDEQDGLTGAPDGTPDQRVERAYDSAGRLRTRWVTRVLDGVVLERATWTYDALGNQLSQEDDLDGDGVILNGWIRQVDAFGRTLSDTTIANGAPSVIVTNTWSASGQLLVQRYDGNADGTPELVSTNTYDAYGRTVLNALDDDDDGVPDQTTAYAYSCTP